jgi:hypothetical protein
LQQKEIGKREENELGRRRCQAREKEKKRKEWDTAACVGEGDKN